jgi:predicted nucleic acid-binding protein
MSEIAYVDANVVLRLLLGEPEEQAHQAERLFLNAANGGVTLVILSPVLAEVIYVLTSPRWGGHTRDEVACTLRELAGLKGVVMDDLPHVLTALLTYETSNLDWVDCLLLSRAAEAQIYTFDKELVKRGAQTPDFA